MGKTVKIYLTEVDAEDIASDIGKGRTELYDTHTTVTKDGETIFVEIHLKKEKYDDEP